MPLFLAATVLHPPFGRKKREPAASCAAVCPVETVRRFNGCRTGQGMAAAGGLPPEAAVPLQACGGRESGRTGTDGIYGWQEQEGVRGIALLDIRQCCDGTGQKHRNGEIGYGYKRFTF